MVPARVHFVQGLYWVQNTSFAMTQSQLSVFTQLLLNGTLQMVYYAPAAVGACVRGCVRAWDAAV